MFLTYRMLKTAGWLAMASAFASIPLTYFSFQLDGSADSGATGILVGIQLVGMILYVAIALFLRRLLNARFTFHDTDRSIDLMIVLNVAASVIAVVATCLSHVKEKEALEIAALAIVAFQGLVQVRFGVRLLRLQDSLDGMLKPFCYLNMATGICMASVVLMLVGVLVSSISDLMLGTIFFYIARLVRAPDSSGAGTEP
jgi:hypothetical protein